MIEILAQIFPNSKFIWLTRSADEVIASSVGRSWYADENHPIWNRIPWFYHAYRVQGDLCGDLEKEQWRRMTPFEKNCWYWQYVNNTIKTDIANLAPARTIHVRIE